MLRLTDDRRRIISTGPELKYTICSLKKNAHKMNILRL